MKYRWKDIPVPKDTPDLARMLEEALQAKRDLHSNKPPEVYYFPSRLDLINRERIKQGLEPLGCVPLPDG